jgi:glutamate-1-semialdehyde 2,1-aminomutase
MTNIGIIHPNPGYHDALREMTRKYGTYLIIDETHTICASPGGYTASFGLQPDFLTLGKPLAGGVPAAIYGFTEEVSQAFNEKLSGRLRCGRHRRDSGGQRPVNCGDESYSPKRLTDEFYAKATHCRKNSPRASKACHRRIQPAMDRQSAWAIAPNTGSAQPAKNGGEAHAAVDPNWTATCTSLPYAFNRGILMTPFHNMALISPETTKAKM